MDTREWREYRIGDIFFQNRGDESAPNQNEEGEIIMINETRDNNGMTRKVEAKSIFNENAITISINFASIVFYQPIKFCASVNIAILRNKNLNKYNSLFLCSILKETWKRYDYGYKISKDRINNTTIFLPTTHDNQPDWQFMEDYIKKIYNKVIEEVKASAPALLSLSLKNRTVLKCDEWKEFRVGELFNVVLSSGDLKLEECEVGEIPLISSGETNNGIVGYITKDDKDKSQIFNNCITIDMFCHAYYQPFNFYAVSHGRVNILIPKQEISKFACLFICAILNNEEYRFNYGRAVYSSTAQNITINLPSTPQGEPDWEWMERYVKRIFG